MSTIALLATLAYMGLGLAFTGILLGTILESILHDRPLDDTVCGKLMQRIFGKH